MSTYENASSRRKGAGRKPRYYSDLNFGPEILYRPLSKHPRRGHDWEYDPNDDLDRTYRSRRETTYNLDSELHYTSTGSSGETFKGSTETSTSNVILLESDDMYKTKNRANEKIMVNQPQNIQNPQNQYRTIGKRKILSPVPDYAVGNYKTDYNVYVSEPHTTSHKKQLHSIRPVYSDIQKSSYEEIQEVVRENPLIQNNRQQIYLADFGKNIPAKGFNPKSLGVTKELVAGNKNAMASLLVPTDQTTNNSSFDTSSTLGLTYLPVIILNNRTSQSPGHSNIVQTGEKPGIPLQNHENVYAVLNNGQNNIFDHKIDFTAQRNNETLVFQNDIPLQNHENVYAVLNNGQNNSFNHKNGFTAQKNNETLVFQNDIPLKNHENVYAVLNNGQNNNFDHKNGFTAQKNNETLVFQKKKHYGESNKFSVPSNGTVKDGVGLNHERMVSPPTFQTEVLTDTPENFESKYKNINRYSTNLANIHSEEMPVVSPDQKLKYSGYLVKDRKLIEQEIKEKEQETELDCSSNAQNNSFDNKSREIDNHIINNDVMRNNTAFNGQNTMPKKLETEKERVNNITININGNFSLKDSADSNFKNKLETIEKRSITSRKNIVLEIPNEKIDEDEGNENNTFSGSSLQLSVLEKKIKSEKLWDTTENAQTINRFQFEEMGENFGTTNRVKYLENNETEGNYRHEKSKNILVYRTIPSTMSDKRGKELKKAVGSDNNEHVERIINYDKSVLKNTTLRHTKNAESHSKAVPSHKLIAMSRGNLPSQFKRNPRKKEEKHKSGPQYSGGISVRKYVESNYKKSNDIFKQNKSSESNQIIPLKKENIDGENKKTILINITENDDKRSLGTKSQNIEQNDRFSNGRMLNATKQDSMINVMPNKEIIAMESKKSVSNQKPLRAATNINRMETIFNDKDEDKEEWRSATSLAKHPNIVEPTSHDAKATPIISRNSTRSTISEKYTTQTSSPFNKPKNDKINITILNTELEIDSGSLERVLASIGCSFQVLRFLVGMSLHDGLLTLSEYLLGEQPTV